MVINSAKVSVTLCRGIDLIGILLFSNSVFVCQKTIHPRVSMPLIRIYKFKSFLNVIHFFLDIQSVFRDPRIYYCQLNLKKIVTQFSSL